MGANTEGSSALGVKVGVIVVTEKHPTVISIFYIAKLLAFVIVFIPN